MFPFLAAALVVLVLGGACTTRRGSSSRYRDDLTTGEAMAQLQKVVKDAAEAAAPGVEYSLLGEELFGGCEETDISAHVQSSWDIEIPVTDRPPATLLPAIADHWEEQGYDVSRRFDADLPEVVATHEGFIFRASGHPEQTRLIIDGATPCVPNPELEEE